MLEGDIRQENKIPGCTKMTRPEEISALSKYLGHVRKVQEEHTKLEKDVLEIPGRNTGRIPKITELEDRLYRLENNSSGEVSRLVHEADLLPENRNRQGVELRKDKNKLPGQVPFVNSLPKDKDTLPGKREKDPGLEKGKETLPGNRPDLSHLPTVAELLEGYEERVKELGKPIESLPDNFNNTKNPLRLSQEKEKISEGERKELRDLPSSSENIPSSKNTSSNVTGLSSVVEEIGGEKKEVGKLSGWSEKISGEKPVINELPKEKITIENGKEVKSLSEISEDLPGKVSEIRELPNKWEKIAGEVPQVNSLPNSFEELPGLVEDPRLVTEGEKIPGSIPEIKNLENGKEDLPGTRPVIDKLENKREDLEIEEINSLSDILETLPGNREEVELETGREEVPGKKTEINSLSQILESIPGKETIPESKLSSTKENIPGEIKDPKLEDNSIDIPASENPEVSSLSKIQEKIEGELKPIDELSTSSESIPGSKEEISKLPQDYEELPGQRKEVELGQQKEDIPGDKKELSSLSTDSEKIIGTPIDLRELPKDSEKILGEVPNITELGTDVENIPGEITGPGELSTYYDKIPGNPTSPEALSDYVDELLPKPEDIEELPTEFQSDQVLPESENLNSNPDSLSDYVDKLEPSPEEIESLPDELPEDGKLIGDPKIPTELSSYVDELEPKPEDIDELPTELPEDGLLIGDPKIPTELSEYVDELLPKPEDIEELPTEFQSDQVLPGDDYKNDFSELPDELPEDGKLIGDPKNDFDELPSEFQEDQILPGDDYKNDFDELPSELPSDGKLEGDLKNDFDELPSELPIDGKVEGDLKNDFDQLYDHAEQLLPEAVNVDSLSDYVEELQPKPEEIDQLSDYQDKLTPEIEEIDSLSDYQEKMVPGVEEVDSLSDYQEKMLPGVEELDSLSDYQEKLDPKPEEVDSLSDHQEKLQPPKSDVEELSDVMLGMYENQHGEPEELSDVVLGMYENQHEEPKSLSEHVEIMEPPKVDVDALSDYQEKMVPGPEEVDALSDYQEKMVPGPEDVEALSDYIEVLNPTPDEVEALSDIVLQMYENQHGEPEELSDIVLQMYENQHEEPDKLSDYLEMMEPTPEEVDSLSDYVEVLNPTPDEVEELSDIVLQMAENQHAEPEELYDSALQMEENHHEDPDKLSEHVELRGGIDPEVELWTENEELPEGIVEVDELSDYLETRPENQGGDHPEGLSDYVDTMDPSELDSFQKLRSDADSIPPNLEAEDRPTYDWITHNVLDGEELDHNHKEFIEKLNDIAKERNDTDKYNKLMQLLSDESGGVLDEGLASKFQTIASAYLGGDRKLPPWKKDEYEHRLIKEGELIGIYDDKDGDAVRERIPWYQAPKLNLSSFNASSWIRKLAEEIIGNKPKGSTRTLLLNETIAMLVLATEQLQKLSKSEPWRLPGSGYGALSDAAGLLTSGGNVANFAGNVVAGALGGGSKVSPTNAPKTGLGGSSGFIGGLGKSDKEPTKGWDKNLSIRNTTTYASGTSGGNLLNNLVSTVLGTQNQDYSFKDNYMKGTGIALTLHDLCNGVTASSIGTVEELFKKLRESPYVSTPNMFTTTPNSGYQCWTLDSNAYWEVVLEPFISADTGNFSYLPSYHEINKKNLELHHIVTHYNKWIPFIGFDLQKSKLVSKTTGLYDGEISYPVSMEFTNEFRLTLVDDQYKSWKTFFETVAEVSVYSSLPHDKSFYESGDSYTVIDTQNVIPANYKNITWRCRIYVMTPQMSTIKYYDLLLVMKDMVEEYTGDIDGAAQDLTISFSIVGENPSTSLYEAHKKDADMYDDDVLKKTGLGFNDGWDIATMAGDLVTKGLSLIT